jgi:TRAP-type C4-dicarboxylate transport system substrate-binding protein
LSDLGDERGVFVERAEQLVAKVSLLRQKRRGHLVDRLGRENGLDVRLDEVIGANPIRLGVPEIYPALQTKMVDTVAASALAAVTLQWYSRVRHVTAHNTAIIVGAIFMRKDKFDALEPDLQTALMSTAERMEVVLNKSIRRDDQKAYDVVRERGIVAVEAGTHKAEWEDAFRKVRERLTGRVYSKSLLQAVEQAARE